MYRLLKVVCRERFVDLEDECQAKWLMLLKLSYGSMQEGHSMHTVLNLGACIG